jgi:hypothetical protein
MRSLLAAVVLVLAVVPLGVAQGTYTQIDYPGAILTQSFGINNAGEIVGEYEDVSGFVHGFVLSSGNYGSIDYPNDQASQAMGINNRGQVVGQTTVAGVRLGFLLDRSTGTFWPIMHVNASNGTFPVGINDSDTVVGYFSSSTMLLGFKLVGSKYTQIEVPGVPFTSPLGVSNAGRIVGQITDVPGDYGSFSLMNGMYSILRIPGTTSLITTGINPSSTAIAGIYSVAPWQYVGFLYQNKTLTTLQFPGATQTYAQGTNDSGVVAGYYFDQRGLSHGFLWTPPSAPQKGH